MIGVTLVLNVNFGFILLMINDVCFPELTVLGKWYSVLGFHHY